MDNDIILLTRNAVRKRASNGKEKLIDEINWLSSLPEKIKYHFPEIIESYINEKTAYYKMPFYDIPTLKQAIFKKQINGETTCKILDEIFDFMYSEFYSKKNKYVPRDFVKKLHFLRFKERIHQTRKKAGIFDRIITKREILWDGVNFLNASLLIKTFEAEDKLIDIISPPWISPIHGDLHFDNILVNTNNSGELINFILIDPRGWAEGSDYAYDLGKLWHSFHGLYDFIHTENFSFKYVEISEEKLKVSLKFKNSSVQKEYQFIFENFSRLLESKFKLNDIDPNWKIRTLFTEAMHFLCLPDFHLKLDGREERAISLYMIGVKFLNEVWKEYSENYK